MKNALVSIFLAVTIYVVTVPAKAVSLAVVTDNDIMPIGGIFSTRLVISELGDFSAPSLSTYDVQLVFDSSIVGDPVVTIGDPVLGDQLDLFGLGGIVNVTPSPGSVGVMELSFDPAADLDSLQAGSFTLFTANFPALSAGSTSLSIMLNALGDANGDPLQVTLQDGVVTVVPIPPAVWLFVSGLLGLIGIARQRN